MKPKTKKVGVSKCDKGHTDRRHRGAPVGRHWLLIPRLAYINSRARVFTCSESGSGITINGNEERRAHFGSAFRGRGTGKMGSKRGWRRSTGRAVMRQEGNEDTRGEKIEKQGRSRRVV